VVTRPNKLSTNKLSTYQASLGDKDKSRQEGETYMNNNGNGHSNNGHKPKYNYIIQNLRTYQSRTIQASNWEDLQLQLLEIYEKTQWSLEDPFQSIEI
jgi:hypothetical protein